MKKSSTIRTSWPDSLKAESCLVGAHFTSHAESKWSSQIDRRLRAQSTLLLTLTVDGEKLTIHYELSLPKRHPLFRALEREEGSSSLATRLTWMFGRLEVNGEPLPEPEPLELDSYPVIDFQVREHRPEGKISADETVGWEALPRWSETDPGPMVVVPGRQPACCKTMRATVQARDVGIEPEPSGPQPVERLRNRLVFDSPLNGSKPVGEFRVLDLAPPSSASDSDGRSCRHSGRSAAPTHRCSARCCGGWSTACRSSFSCSGTGPASSGAPTCSGATRA